MAAALTCSSVAIVVLLWSWPSARRRLGFLRLLATALAPRWWVLFVLGLAMSIVFAVLGGNFVRIQVASDLDEVARLVGDDGATRYRWLAIFDLAYAAVYGLFGLSLVSLVRRWGDGETFGATLRRIGSVGGGFLVCGALFDELENVQLLRILTSEPLRAARTGPVDRDLADEGDGLVQLMTTLGSVKWALVVLGAVLVLGAFAVRALTRVDARQWLAKVRG